MQQALASPHWPMINGVVTRSSVGRSVTENSSSQSSSGSGNHRSISYYPDVAYEYAVDGVVYSNNWVTIGDFSNGDRLRARRAVCRYPVGEPVTVFYRSEKPGYAVRQPGPSGFLRIRRRSDPIFSGFLKCRHSTWARASLLSLKLRRAPRFALTSSRWPRHAKPVRAKRGGDGGNRTPVRLRVTTASTCVVSH